MGFERRRLLVRAFVPVFVFFELRVLFARGNAPGQATFWAFALTVPTLAILLLTYYLNVAIHEGGHWLAGKLMGFQTHSIQIGPLWWRNTRNGGKLQLSPWRGRIGGFAAMWPKDSKALRSRFAVFVLGGPLANLLSLVLIFAMFGRMPHHLNVTIPVFLYQVFVLFLLVYALMMGLLNLVPFHTHGLGTDGRKLLTILQGGARFKRMMALLNLSNLMRGGMRPRDYPPEIMRALTSAPDGSTEHAQALLISAFHAFDSGHDEEAVQLAMEAADTVSPKAAIYHAIFNNEAAGIVAWLGGGATNARALLEKSNPKLLMHPFARPRSEAAVLAAEGKYSGALDKIQQAEALLDIETKAEPELFRLERDWIASLRQRIDQNLTQSEPNR